MRSWGLFGAWDAFAFLDGEYPAICRFEAGERGRGEADAAGGEMEVGGANSVVVVVVEGGGG